MIRTSITHPLAIAAIPAGAGLGRVGVTFCPGKKQPNAFTGAWDRDLALDVTALADWGAAALVTLVEEHELKALVVEALGATVTAAGIEWLHLPIRDVSTPDTAFEAAWQHRSFAPLAERDLMKRFVSRHADGTYSCTGRCFDIGITTRPALARFARSGDPLAGSTDPMTAAKAHGDDKPLIDTSDGLAHQENPRVDVIMVRFPDPQPSFEFMRWDERPNGS